MLIDKVRVDFSAGKGGDGFVSFEINGKPQGGDGGRGGDIILRGSHNRYDLNKFRSTKKFEAENGENGSNNRKTGAEGENLIVEVPYITKVLDLEGNLIGEITPENNEILLLKGGGRGRGNHYFRKGQLSTLKKRTLGKPGEKLQVFLELNLIADVLYVGLPNAGKSSLLNMFSNANAKVANYPFTTLEPKLGIYDGVVLMDFPGLIEGASEGKGLGWRHFKHTKYIRLLLHTISLEDDLAASYNLIRDELLGINEKLAKTEEIIVFTKKDMFEQEIIDEKVELFKNKIGNKKIYIVSIYDQSSIYSLLNDIKRKLS